MTNAVDLIPAFGIGLTLGAFFFGGLWWTVRRLAVSPNPTGLLCRSLAIRFGIAMTGFSLVMSGEGVRLALAVLGFLAVRELIARRLFPDIHLSGGLRWKS